MATPGLLPGSRVHVEDELKVPVEFVVKLTVPVGVVGPSEVSITLAVQVVGVFTTTEPGEQVMLVCVAWVNTDVTVMLTVVGVVVAPRGVPFT